MTAANGRPSMSPDAPAFDLQSHSTHSDGSLAPGEVVAQAAAAGVELLALTDHDTVAGVPEALAAARARGIRLSPAAELSSVHGEHEDLHVLGYELDPSDSGLQAALEDFRADRGRRIHAMADRLRELGFALDDSSFAARESLGRPHLADAVLTHPDNAERLAREGITSKKELFPPYLVRAPPPTWPVRVPRSRRRSRSSTPPAGWRCGASVLGHRDPGHVLDTVRQFAARGLDGVECFYAEHTRDQALLLHGECEARGLLSTGSADFHGPGHEHFDRFRAFELHGRTPRLGPIGG